MLAENKSEEIKKYENFKVSHGWLINVRKRAGIVPRAPTAVRVYPDDTADISMSFIRDIQNTIKDNNILPSNIINMDQVPRYFEGSQRKTLATKGAKRILLRKSTGHKRFTATLAITAASQILTPHVLFSKLKRIPKISASVDVDVNETGMWSVQIVRKWFTNTIFNRPATALYRQKTLVLMDSYGAHIKLLEDTEFADLLQRKNVSPSNGSLIENPYNENVIMFQIIVKIIPPGLTGLLQPLDVAVNRSFQSFYEQKFSEYAAENLSNGKDENRNETHRRLKIPSYGVVATWVAEWKEKFVFNVEKDPFKVCGYVHPDMYDPSTLHKPLYELIQSQMSIEDWESMFKDDVCELCDLFDGDDRKYYFPPETDNTLYDAIKFKFPNECTFLEGIRDQHVDDRDIEQIGLELDAVIEMFTVDKDLLISNKRIFNEIEPIADLKIIIGRMDDYYFIER